MKCKFDTTWLALIQTQRIALRWDGDYVWTTALTTCDECSKVLQSQCRQTAQNLSQQWIQTRMFAIVCNMLKCKRKHEGCQTLAYKLAILCWCHCNICFIKIKKKRYETICHGLNFYARNDQNANAVTNFHWIDEWLFIELIFATLYSNVCQMSLQNLMPLLLANVLLKSN